MKQPRIWGSAICDERKYLLVAQRPVVGDTELQKLPIHERIVASSRRMATIFDEIPAENELISRFI
jgi:hypothetical protein